jgi:hypothetical protein
MDGYASGIKTASNSSSTIRAQTLTRPTTRERQVCMMGGSLRGCMTTVAMGIGIGSVVPLVGIVLANDGLRFTRVKNEHVRHERPNASRLLRQRGSMRMRSELGIDGIRYSRQ